MDLLQNPFHILTASPRDNRLRIVDLADERSLLFDSSEINEARANLTNPMKRLSAEVAWLPGIGPKRANELISIIESSPADLLTIDKLPSIGRTNLVTAGLSRLTVQSADELAEWILEISWALENVDKEELRMLINEERLVAGFPEVSDTASVEREIEQRRRHYRDVINSSLDRLPPAKLVMALTIAVESATYNGEQHGPALITDLIDSYEVAAQEFLDKEEENIQTLVEQLEASVNQELPDSKLAPLVDQLIKVVKNWDTVAQPIQVSKKSLGFSHDASLRVARLVRDLAVHMFNEHDKLDFSQKLTSMIQEVFAEVGEVAERSAEDADALHDIAEQRTRLLEDAKSRAEEWRREITYEADVGAVFKDKLRISPEGIEWKGQRWPLESIRKVRWGGTRHSVNGIPTGTTYKIVFGDGRNQMTIELRKQATYTNFIDRLWRAVGVRLLTEYLEGLRDGKKYRFSNAVMSDTGMDLERRKLFGSNQRIFCPWSELVVWDGPGVFCIGKKSDKKLAAAFSYQDDDNIHILETAIRMFWKKGGKKISSLLGE